MSLIMLHQSELTEGPGRLLYFLRGDVRWTADGGHLVLGVCEIFLAREAGRVALQSLQLFRSA